MKTLYKPPALKTLTKVTQTFCKLECTIIL